MLSYRSCVYVFVVGMVFFLVPYSPASLFPDKSRACRATSCPIEGGIAPEDRDEAGAEGEGEYEY